MDLTVLFDAGLTINEAKVYLTLLEQGSSPVTDITKSSGVHRVNVYDVIERLSKKGLISSVTKKNKQYYEAADPEELIHLLESKKENIRKSIPEMKLLFENRKEKENVHFFKGPQGVYNAYNMILEEGKTFKTLYGMGGSGLNRKILKHRHELFDKERIKKGIHVKALYYESLRKDKEEAKEKLWELRYIPDKYKNNLMLDICGKLSIILLPTLDKEEIIAIVIENKEIADGYRKMFEYMWELSKE
jgi:sugar-specific transcriptional regulator TrmB